MCASTSTGSPGPCASVVPSGRMTTGRSSVARPSWTQLRSPNCSGHLDVPGSLLGLHPLPLSRDIEMAREPDVREALHVPEQLVQHRDARVPSDAKGVHDEKEAAAHSVGA